MMTIFLWTGIFYVVTRISCYGWNSTTTRKEKFHSINSYMHRRCTAVWTQRNGTHSEMANKPQYPMITGPTLNECNNMKIMKKRMDYRYNWNFSILKEHFFHSPLEILLFNQSSFTPTIYAEIGNLFDFNKSPEIFVLKSVRYFLLIFRRLRESNIYFFLLIK